MNSLQKHLSEIKQTIEDPSRGLPEEVFEFITTVTPMVNVDLLIKDDAGRILLSWRNDEACGRGWHIPGGIIRYKEKAEERIQKTALKEFGSEVIMVTGPIEIHEILMPQEPRGHFISLLYECRLPIGYLPPQELLWREGAEVIGSLQWHDRMPEMVRGQTDVYAHLFVKGDKQ